MSWAAAFQNMHARAFCGLPASTSRLNTAWVHFNREGTTYRCSINMQMGALPMKSAEARDKDIYLAFNSALNKVAKQLRRTKREVREDKAERLDEDVVLREGLIASVDNAEE